MTQARHIRVTGLVQGVGFRPFVWRLAKELDLAGWVRNDAAGVEIAAEGEGAQLDSLLRRLVAEAPPLARVEQVQAVAVPAVGSGDFVIAESGGGEVGTAIGHDTGLCPDCLEELFDPADRRWRHAFITCTHCGPRYTLSRRLPYDRANTSLAAFALCPDCGTEYADPADRRFHAEPICCPRCGPQLQCLAADGEAIAGDPIAATLALLRAGKIVALKGLGGFHLACDARNGDAVAELRRRKNREEKPFAVMAANTASLAAFARIDGGAKALLESAERPIVLLPKGQQQRSMKSGAGSPLPLGERDRVRGEFPPLIHPPHPALLPQGEKEPTAISVAELTGVAPGLQWLGAMLPATPIQWLLFHEAAGRPAGKAWLAQAQDLLLVMTSANPGGEPLVVGNDEAVQRLAGIADGYLLHDRDIVARCDDSVLRATSDPVRPEPVEGLRTGEVEGQGASGGRFQFIRRARGYTPVPIKLSVAGPAVLALGAGLKNTLCLTRGDEAFVSAHIGDLDNVATCGFLEQTLAHWMDILAVQPAAVACDLHPDFHSTRLAQGLAEAWKLPLIPVQHHYAHLAAIAAEHRITAPFVGLALDGVGLGSDGAAWGGELLRVDGAACTRLGHLLPLALPGGDRAAREPWRMAAAALHRLGRGDEIARRFPHQAAAAQLHTILDKGLNAPLTSSLGRVFDAAAALLELKPVASFEGQAAMLLEGCAAAYAGTASLWPGSWSLAQGNLDLLPLLARLADWQGSREEAAAAFHRTLAQALADWVEATAPEAEIVALGGGCFLNAILTAQLSDLLAAAGRTVLTARAVPPNDGGIALGQAWVALQQLSIKEH